MSSNYIAKTFPGATPIRTGGQKEVFKYLHPLYGWVVLKIGNCEPSNGFERIEREVDILKNINSEYFPKQYQFYKPDESCFLIIEEWIEGVPLDSCMSRFYDPKDAVSLTLKIIEGMEILWKINVIHRDLKPQNILIRPDSTPVIIDLGIARLLGESSITGTWEQSPMTPVYAAPEQIQNRKADIGPRTDQYNLGIILAQLLLRGVHPFSPSCAGGTNIQTNIANGRWGRSRLEERVNLDLVDVIGKMLGKEPYTRYRKSDELSSSLKSCSRSIV